VLQTQPDERRDHINQLRFPKGSSGGAATAAYQIEDAPGADGKGVSIWDTFSHTPGKVWHRETGGTACDSYRRYPKTSPCWNTSASARTGSVCRGRGFSPTPAARPTPKRLDHYKRLADALGEKGIEPVITLYHWDLPQALQDKGRWAPREVAEIFGEFAAIAGEALGGRVGRWITINEPWVVEHVRGRGWLVRLAGVSSCPRWVGACVPAAREVGWSAPPDMFGCTRVCAGY
jgi:beta-glucosidase